jgi:RNA polymerase sigma-70 factor (ECF subfamily)
MAEDREFLALMERVRSGCDEAAREMFDRYSSHISRIVRRYLHQRLRSQYDSLDFLQAVWASFFAVPKQQQHCFTDSNDLVTYLATMAFHKVIDATRRRFGRAEDANREQSLGELTEDDLKSPPLRQPTPSQVAIAEESWERLLHGVGEPLRHALTMLRDGHTYHEIKSELGVHPKVLQRFLQRLIQRSGLS